MRQGERRVIRAAMRWYRSFNRGTNYREIEKADDALFNACAALPKPRPPRRVATRR